MLSIPEKNQTVYEVIYESLNIKKTGIKNIKEFGFYTYCIYPDPLVNPSHICMAFSAPGFKEILEYSGKEFLQEEFKDFIIEENITKFNVNYDLQIKIDVQKYSSLFQTKKGLTAEEKKKLNEDNQALNEENDLYILPSSDRIQLIYGIHFSQQTDVALTKNFLQELLEAKRHVKNCIDAKIYIDKDSVPNEISNIVKKEKYSNGLVVFDLYIKDYNTLIKRLNTFVLLREYIQFHIHSIKTFLHIRMNKKGKELINKLNACRIIPLDYLRSIEVENFYAQKEKKEENLAIQRKESEKMNMKK